jgi:hypothetical protein
VWQTEELVLQILARSCSDWHGNALLVWITENLQPVCQCWHRLVTQHWLKKVVAWAHPEAPRSREILQQLQSLHIGMRGFFCDDTWRRPLQLLWMPRLRELVFYCSSSPLDCGWDKLLKQGVCLLPVLRSLTLYSDARCGRAVYLSPYVPSIIFSMTGLQCLVLRRMQVKPTHHFTALQQLRTLKLKHCRLNLGGLARVWSLTWLTRLSLCANYFVDMQQGVVFDDSPDRLSLLQSLHTLSLHCYQPPDDALRTLTRLTTLKLRPPSDQPPMLLSQAQCLLRLTRLTRLSLSASPHTAQILATCSHLTRLCLMNTTVDNFNTLLPLTPQLRHLTCWMQATLNSRLFLGALTCLQTLDLAITRGRSHPTFVPTLVELEQSCSTLQHLVLQGPLRVSLTTLQQLNQLQQLDLGTSTLEANSTRPSSVLAAASQHVNVWGHSRECWHESPVFLKDRSCCLDCSQHSLRLLLAVSHEASVAAPVNTMLPYLEQVMRPTTQNALFPVL